MTTGPMPSVSLLHATFHAVDPVGVRDTWLTRARYRDRVEHIFALDADDDDSSAATKGHRRVMSPPGNGVVTSVRNWNAAAAAATGDLLFVIADDLLPPEEWDVALRDTIRGLDPHRAAFAVKIRDGGNARDTVLRHPIVSRRFYVQYGLFCPAFRGVFCDNDISIRAFRSAVIIDGRHVPFLHGDPRRSSTPETLSKKLGEPGTGVQGRIRDALHHMDQAAEGSAPHPSPGETRSEALPSPDCGCTRGFQGPVDHPLSRQARPSDSAAAESADGPSTGH